MSMAAAIEAECRDIIPFVLNRDRRSAKIIALRVGATPRSVDNWKEGYNFPQVPHFIMLAREIPELRQKVLEWLDASTGDSGDNPERLATEIAQFLMNRKG